MQICEQFNWRMKHMFDNWTTQRINPWTTRDESKNVEPHVTFNRFFTSAAWIRIYKHFVIDPTDNLGQSRECLLSKPVTNALSKQLTKHWRFLAGDETLWMFNQRYHDKLRQITKYLFSQVIIVVQGKTPVLSVYGWMTIWFNIQLLRYMYRIRDGTCYSDIARPCRNVRKFLVYILHSPLSDYWNPTMIPCDVKSNSSIKNL